MVAALTLFELFAMQYKCKKLSVLYSHVLCILSWVRIGRIYANYKSLNNRMQDHSSLPYLPTNSELYVDNVVDAPERLNEAFRNDSWLQSYPLNKTTILDYFAWSPFYTLSCNNETCKMQNLPLDTLR